MVFWYMSLCIIGELRFLRTRPSFWTIQMCSMTNLIYLWTGSIDKKIEQQKGTGVSWNHDWQTIPTIIQMEQAKILRRTAHQWQRPKCSVAVGGAKEIVHFGPGNDPAGCLTRATETGDIFRNGWQVVCSRNQNHASRPEVAGTISGSCAIRIPRRHLVRKSI